MANILNVKGTSFPSFTVGKRGSTILQGSTSPSNSDGKDGDIYLQSGSSSALWQKVAGTWNKIGNFGSKIFTGTTSVDTAQVADTITLNANGKRVVNVANDALSVNGEKLTIKNGNTSVQLLVNDDSAADPVDLIVDLQGTGALKIQSDADSAIRTSDGSSITVQPGDKSTGTGGSVEIKGGNTTAAGAAGGDILLTPGNGGTGSSAAQVRLPTGYRATAASSVVNRLSLLDLMLTTLTASTLYMVGTNEHAVLVDRTGATSVVLPNTDVPAGHQVKVKEANGGGTVTVTVTGGANIDGSASVVLTAWQKATFIWTGTKWLTI